MGAVVDTECSLTEVTLREYDELVGPYRGMRVDGDFFHVRIHDWMLVYPTDSDQARALQEGLREVADGARVGVLHLELDGLPRVFVRVEGGTA